MSSILIHFFTLVTELPFALNLYSGQAQESRTPTIHWKQCLLSVVQTSLRVSRNLVKSYFQPPVRFSPFSVIQDDYNWPAVCISWSWRIPLESSEGEYFSEAALQEQQYKVISQTHQCRRIIIYSCRSYLTNFLVRYCYLMLPKLKWHLTLSKLLGNFADFIILPVICS